jgi:hypothetical protein
MSLLPEKTSYVFGVDIFVGEKVVWARNTAS